MPERGVPANLAAVDAAPVLTPEDVGFIQSPVSILTAAQGANRRPVMTRAIGAAVEPNGRVRILLRDGDAAALMVGARAHDRVAVMFSRPQTTETIQLKGDMVSIEPATAADDALRRRYLPMMIAELMPIGYSAAFVGCVASDHGSALYALSFRPTQLFDQTPGPNAGRCRNDVESAA